VVAKGNTIEVWNLNPEGLVEVCKTDVWGMVVGLEWVGKAVSEDVCRISLLLLLIAFLPWSQGQSPHIVVQTDHPLSRILLYRFVSADQPSLFLTATHWVDRKSRTAEFLTGLVVDRSAGIVIASLYVGMLSVIEIGVKDKDSPVKGSRRASTVGKGKKRERKDTGEFNMEIDEQADVLDIKDVYEIK
jgi:hypothetical protein